MNSNITLTVFTPTYNRSRTLPTLFDSLMRQSCTNFEWLIVNDGSTDNTVEVVDEFIKISSFPISIINIANGGKHRAINLAAKEAAGDWIMIVDSDDYLVNDALYQILEAINLVNDDTSIGLIRGLRAFPQLDAKHSFKVPKNPCHFADWLKSQRPFDTTEVIRKTALQKYSFPEIPGERFMAEGWLWHQIDQMYQTWFVNYYFVECLYQADGLSANASKIRAKSPVSAMLVYAAMLESTLPWDLQLRVSINWWRYLFHARSQHKKIILQTRPSRLFALLGLFMFKRDQSTGK